MAQIKPCQDHNAKTVMSKRYGQTEIAKMGQNWIWVIHVNQYHPFYPW
jgi:hypothetical protein